MFHERQIDAFYNLQRFTSICSIDSYRAVIQNSLVEITNLYCMAGAPISGPYICGAMGMPYFRIAAVQFIKSHVLQQPTTSPLTQYFSSASMCAADILPQPITATFNLSITFALSENGHVSNQSFQQRFGCQNVLTLLFAGNFPLNGNGSIIADFLQSGDQTGIVHFPFSKRHFGA